MTHPAHHTTGPRVRAQGLDAYLDLLRSWQLALTAQGRSPLTLRQYRTAAEDLYRFLRTQDRPTDPRAITRQDVAAYLVDACGALAPATGYARHKALRLWFGWLVEEQEIEANPLDRIPAPTVPERPVPVLGTADLRKLLRTTQGADFRSRRDAAVLSLLIDSGLRRSELAGLGVADVDLAAGVCLVRGKGNRQRIVPFGDRTAATLDRYRRARRDHPHARSDRWWLGAKGGLTDDAIYDVVKLRAEQAGLDLYPHQLRHAFAHAWLVGGGQEGDLMRLAGWRSRRMLGRYAAAAADERAREAYRAHSPVDGL